MRRKANTVLRSLALGLFGVLALQSAAMPAFGQGTGASDEGGMIHAPCLSGLAAEADLIAAMNAAGWEHLQRDSARATAAQGPNEALLALVIFQPAFLSPEEVTDFVADAATTQLPRLAQSQVFTRGNLSATIWVNPQADGITVVQCIFAGTSVPGTTEILGDAPFALETAAFIYNSLESDPDAGQLHVDALRFTGPEALLAPLSGREAIVVSYQVTPPQ